MNNKKEYGFALLPIVFAVVIVGLTAFIVTRIYGSTQQQALSTDKNNAVTVAPAGSQTSTVISKDGHVSFNVPDNWQIVKNYPLDAPQCNPFNSPRTANGNTGRCSLSVALAPKGFSGESQWYIRVYKTEDAPKAWAEFPLGLERPEFMDQSEAKINGYDAFYTKIVDASYTDLNYFIEHGGHIVYAWTREKSVNPSTDLSRYSQAFDSIVRSVTFK
jgi:type II secretory pathway pseudopilin PulG